MDNQTRCSERIAEQEGVIFENPEFKIVERDCCVLYGTAVIQDKETKKPIYAEWTIGEADKKTNCHNNYIFAMAEKRLKDRLTLKLVGAYEYGVYSDTEADSFKQSPEEKIMNQPYATKQQKKAIDKLLKETGFTVGVGVEIKDDTLRIMEEEDPLTKETASQLLTRLYDHTAMFNAKQKESKVV